MKSTQIRSFSRWPGGRLERVRGGQNTQGRVGKQLLKAKGPNWDQGTGHSQLILLRVRWRREMMLLMMKMMMRWEPVCHKDSVYIALSTNQTSQKRGEEDTDSQHNTFSSPSWDFTPPSLSYMQFARILISMGFHTIILWPGKMIKVRFFYSWQYMCY